MFNVSVVQHLLDAGYAVAAADYPVLDSVRAAQHIGQTGVTPTGDVLLSGHSQGGHAVLFSAQFPDTGHGQIALQAVPDMLSFFAAARTVPRR